MRRGGYEMHVVGHQGEHVNGDTVLIAARAQLSEEIASLTGIGEEPPTIVSAEYDVMGVVG